MKFDKKRALVTTALILGLDSGAVTAQMLEEVIVSARKRDESLQDVPVVVTALSRDALERFAVTSIDDLANFVPGLSSATGGGTDPAGFLSLRGVKTGSINVTSDQSVSLNLDGMQIESVIGYRSGQIDLAQIEVLKGPQALFFGKNSPGGVISISTANPTDELYVRARGRYEAEDGDKIGELVVSGPLTDTLGGRAVLFTSSREGYMSNDAPTANTSHRPAVDEWLVRGTLEWEPTENFRALAKVTRAEGEAAGRNDVQKLICFDPSATSSQCGLDFTTTIAAPIDLTGRFGGLQPKDDTEATFATLEMKWDFANNLSLTSVTGFYDVSQNYYDSIVPRGENDQYIFGINPDGSFLFAPNEIIGNGITEVESFSQEFRLTSDYDGPFNFMLGAFVDDRQMVVNTKTNFAFFEFPAMRQTVDAEALSVFGQISYQLTDNLELSGGVRYTDETKNYSGVLLDDAIDVGGGFVLVAPPGLPPEFLLGQAGDSLIPTEDEINPDNVSTELTLTWRPTDDITLYAAFKEGFKSGSFDMGPVANQGLASNPAPIAFNNEEVVGGEIGFKTMLMDNQLRLNGAAYYYDYEDMQLATFDPVTLASRTVNAGESEVQGFEVDFMYAPSAVEGLTLFGFYNYNIAEYVDFITDCSASDLFAGNCADNGLQQLGGAPLSQAPENAANLGFTYENQLTDSLTYRLGGLISWNDEMQTDSLNDVLGLQDSFTTYDLNIALATPNDRWVFEVIGRNLSDETILTSSLSQPATGIPGFIPEDWIGSVARGRQIVFQLTYNYQ